MQELVTHSQLMSSINEKAGDITEKSRVCFFFRLINADILCYNHFNTKKAIALQVQVCTNWRGGPWKDVVGPRDYASGSAYSRVRWTMQRPWLHGSVQFRLSPSVLIIADCSLCLLFAGRSCDVHFARRQHPFWRITIASEYDHCDPFLLVIPTSQLSIFHVCAHINDYVMHCISQLCSLSCVHLLLQTATKHGMHFSQ